MRPVSVLLALVLIPTQLIALTYLDYAHILAKEGIINEREDDTRYRVDDLVWRQEVIGMAVNISDDIDLERYACT